MVVVAGLGRGALNYIPWSVYNYMPDVDEIVTGRRREGAFAGVMTFVRKLMQSRGHVRGGPDPRRQRPHPETSRSSPVQVVEHRGDNHVIGALGLMVFGFIVSLRFRLNSDTHAVLMHEIERFKKQPGTQPTPENRAVVEDLTGWKYEELWGKGKS